MIQLLIANPLLLLFTVAGIGYLIGRIKIKGASLGVAAVLFVGLAFGALDPKMRLPDIVYQLGLLLFVYTVGLSGGADFVHSLRQRGARDVIFITLMLAFALLIALAAGRFFGFPAPLAAGLYVGGLTNTPALASVLESVALSHPGDAQVAALPVVGYSLGYPIGVLGMIAVLFIMRRALGVSPEEEARRLKAFGVKTESARGETLLVTRPAATGRSISELYRANDWDVVFGRVKRADHLALVQANTRLEIGDLVTVVGDRAAIDAVAAVLGQRAQEHIEFERSDLDFRRIFVSNPAVAGRRLSDLAVRNTFDAIITRIRRGDLDLTPHGDTVLQLGDRVRVVASRDRMPAIARYFGDSYRSLSEIDVLTFSLGIAIGLLIGLIPIPLPGGATFRLGIAGGPLLVALALGALQRTGPVVWTIPYSANLTLRQFGLVLFLAGIGTQAGFAFVSTLRQGGALPMLLTAAAITCCTGLLTVFLAYRAFKMPFGLASGLVAGLQTQPAVLGFALDQEHNDVPNTAYASAFPVAMIVKIVLAQVILIVLAR